DAVLLNRAVHLNSLSGLCITKLDVLDGLKEVKICVAYQNVHTLEITKFPSMQKLEDFVPIYETYPGWNKNTLGLTTLQSLPDEARTYLQRIEEIVKVPIDIVSTGPDRSNIIIMRDIFIL
ncbi:MAG: adenylosuccinate synthetase, partial [Buchnera aphidicola]|nr:adenylosuccinate synthetase [Buchnera aphidicola]